jgi:uncharacterized protein with von Willebrand factor type A (vWA) domain
MSKGSRQRPVDKAKFDAEFDRIFGKNTNSGVKSTNTQSGASNHADVQRQEKERREG